MRIHVLTLTLCLLAVCPQADAQRLEKTIWVPDSVSGASYPSHLQYLPAHNMLYIGGSGQVIALDCATNRKVARIPTGRSISALCYNPTNDKVYATDRRQNSVTIIDAATNQPLVTIPVGYGPCDLCYNRQNNKVYCALGNRTVLVIDGVTNQVRDTIPVGRDPVALGYNPTSNKVYCVNEDDDNVTVIDGGSDSVVATVSVGNMPRAVACDAAANRVYVSSIMDRQVAVIDGTTNQVLTRIEDVPSTVTMAYNPTNSMLYCTGGGGLTVVDTRSDSVVAHHFLPGGGYGYDLAVNEARNRVYNACGQDTGWVVVVDGVTHAIVAQIPVGDEPKAVCFNATENRYYTADAVSDQVTVIDAAGDSVIATVRTASTLTAACLNPATGRLYVADGSGDNVVVIDATGDSLLATAAAGDYPQDVACNPTNNRIYCVNAGDNSASVIDGATNQMIATFPMGQATQAVSWYAELNKAYVTDYDFLAIISGPGDSVLRRLRTGWGSLNTCYNPVNNKVYVTHDDDHFVAVLDGAGDSILGTIASIRFPCLALYCRAQNKVYVTCEYGGYWGVTVIDGAGDSILKVFQAGTSPMAICEADGDVYIANSPSTAPGSVSILDPTLDTIVATVTVGRAPRALAYDPASNRVYCANYADGSVSVIDCVTRSVRTTIPVGTSPQELVWHPTRNRVYVVNNGSSSVSVIDDAGGIEETPNAEVRTANRGTTIVRGVLFLGVGSRQHTAYRAELLDVAGRKVMELTPGDNDVRHVAPGVHFVVTPSPFSSPTEGNRVGVRRGRESPITKVVIAR